MTARPHVLLVLASEGWGGTEKAFVELAGTLAERTRVTVAIPHGAVYAHRFASAVTQRTLRSGSRRNPLVALHLARLIAEVAPDVVHAHAARAAEMVFWATRLEHRPHVATKHNTRPRWIFRHIRRVTAVSQAAAASVGGGREVEVVYNAVDARPVEAGSKPERFTVLAVGRLHPHKGFDGLIRAMATLSFDWSLRIAGEGPQRGELERLAESLGVTSRVELLGHREDVAELAAAAHVQVVSSRTEGFSLALVEGVHFCDVVLSTPVGVAPEILPDPLLVDASELAARLREVHDRYDGFAELTSGVRAGLADRFSPAAVADRYLAVYERARAD